MRRNLSSFLVLAISFSVAAPVLRSDETAEKTVKTIGTESKKTKKGSSKKADVKAVEMFQAMEQGLISVDYIGKDATVANLIFKNKGEVPLDIVLPATFGAVPVLAQGMMGGMGGGMGGMGGGMGGMGGGMGGMGGGMGGQGMGGGMGGMGGGMGGMGGGMGGMMRVEPDRPRKFTVPTLCLTHGKADPNPRMKYKVVRLTEVNDSPVIAEFCKALSAGKVGQNTAQAAAWHVANGLTWEELVRKPRVISDYTGVEMFFSRYEVQAAMRFTALATVQADNLADYNQEPVASTPEESIGEKLSK